jgi:hypothetical protein
MIVTTFGHIETKTNVDLKTAFVGRALDGCCAQKCKKKIVEWSGHFAIRKKMTH